MDETLSLLFDDLNESAPGFREIWAQRFASGLGIIEALDVDETIEGGEVLYKGALALHLIHEALSALPETRSSTDALFRLQVMIANARRGASGPLSVKDLKARGGRPLTAQGLHKAMCAAVAVELLKRASPDRTENQVVREVGEFFRKAGVRGTKGARLADQTVTKWYERSTIEGSVEQINVAKRIKSYPPLTQEAARDEVWAWAKEAAVSENLTGC